VIALIQANLVPMLVALLIGIVTARWMFRRPPSKSNEAS
jgi:predicted permease